MSLHQGTRPKPGLLLVCLLAGCTSGYHSWRAERSALRLLAERDSAVLGQRESTARFPAARAASAPADGSPGVEARTGDGDASAPPEPRAPRTVLDLRQALAVAYGSSRAMIDRREDLHLDALSLGNQRHDFDPQLDLILSSFFSQTSGLAEEGAISDGHGGAARFTASQLLRSGALATVQAGLTGDASTGTSALYGSSFSFELDQPLLRGAGYAVSHEPLIQAERNLVYALRDFELFREDFSIDVARRFYDLVNRKQSIDNQRRNLENNEFGRRQAEALFAVGRANELDVLRARRSELTARNALLEAEEGLELALDNFRIFLGLPEGEPIDVEPDPPEFTPVAYDMRSAIEVALENRLDFLSRREQLEDVERALAIARNGLLPDLSLSVRGEYDSTPFDSLLGSQATLNDTRFGLSLEVPLDRVRERNSYRSAEIAVERARRNLEEFEDQLRVNIHSSFRELERRLQSLEIQRQLITDQTKNLRIAELRFERGELPNRDVVEANQSLLDAQNALIDEQVSYEIARLQLLRDLGILFVEEDGMWKR